jgi:hypothetical protein
MEDGGGKGSDNKDFEQKLGEALFADDVMESREAVREEDVPDDAFTTEVCVCVFVCLYVCVCCH